MKLSAFKKRLEDLPEILFELNNGVPVPQHFHVTEVGQCSRNFIDCGGTVRSEKSVIFQLWHAGDTEHRLTPERLLSIIRLSEEQLGIGDADIEVEYQSDTIGRYALGFNGRSFVLENKHTACLATDRCGIPAEMAAPKIPTQQALVSSCCAPGSGCC